MSEDFEQKSNQFSPDWASPPGDTISDLLEEKNWRVDQLADLLQLSMKDTNELISGNIPITEEISHKLNQVLGGGVKFWLNREYQYREQLIKLNKES
jgi:HTH-type transcriptional regulator/antitoxin HigA